MNKLQITSFRAFKDTLTINFNEKNFLLYGENGSGKSSIFDALKIIFFKDEIASKITVVSTPEEQEHINNDFWSKYNNKIFNHDFQLVINDLDYNSFSIDGYQSFMVSLENISTPEKLNLQLLLAKFHLDIPNLNLFCTDFYTLIEDNVNCILAKFKESIVIEIDIEEDFAIKIIDVSRQLESSSELNKYFNEAKLNLVIILLLFSSIQIAEDKTKKRILILDDFITSLDASNRTFLIKYIFDNFSEFQILIFTHNVSFYNLIMYLINEIYQANSKWEFANMYEIENNSKLYVKSSIEKVEQIKEFYLSLTSANNTHHIEDVGNKIRQKFEILLYEFSKLIMVGAVEDSRKILDRIENSKNIYFKNSKTASDLIDEITAILENGFQNNLNQRLVTKISEYKYPDFKNFKTVIKELKLYQKVTMHPMSHGSSGQISFTTSEIEKSLELLEKMENSLKIFVGDNVIGV